jgi:hypothetical protein
MALDPTKSPPPSKARAIVQRTRGLYQRLTRWRCQGTLGSLRTAESFFRGLPLIGRRPGPLRGGMRLQN